MATHRMKLPQVEAVQWTGGNQPEVDSRTGLSSRVEDGVLYLPNEGGDPAVTEIIVPLNYWIAVDERKHINLLTDADFAISYEPILTATQQGR